MTYQPLLPGNSTPLKRQAAQALAEIQRVPIPLRTLYNPDECPQPLLPYLAWAFSVDRWDSKWLESAKRAACRVAYYVHSHKGTIGALRRVVEPLGYLIEIAEWWQTVPNGTPGTFTLRIGVLDSGITESMYQELATPRRGSWRRHSVELRRPGQESPRFGDEALGCFGCCARTESNAATGLVILEHRALFSISTGGAYGAWGRSPW